MSPRLFGRARGEAEAVVGSCETTLAILESSHADLGPAARLRDRARSALEDGDYREAATLARKSEEVAKLLDRLHTAASGGVARLRSERARMARFGMDVSDVDRLLAEATVWMGRFVERDGDPRFPAYAKAGEIALRGLRAARDRIPLFKGASEAVQGAEQAVRAAIDGNRFVSREAFEFFVMKPATDALREARGKLGAGAFPEARDLGRWTLAMVKEIEERYGKVTEAYLRTESGKDALKGEGAAVREIEDVLGVARSALEQGKFDEALGVLGRAETRVGEVREAYRALLLRRRNVEAAIEEVEGWGFDARDARSILKEGIGLMDGGRYDDAASRMDAARTAATSLRDTHRTAATRIAEMRRASAAMRASSPSGADEAEGLLGKAEALLDEGRYKEVEENLQIVALLVDVGTAAASPSAGLDGFLQAARRLEAGCPTCGGPLDPAGMCPTCNPPGVVENPEPEGMDPVVHAVDEARRLLDEIGREDGRLVEEVTAQVQGCAMCGGPLGGEDVLCGKCQSLVRGR